MRRCAEVNGTVASWSAQYLYQGEISFREYGAGASKKVTIVVVIYWEQSVFLPKNLCDCFTSLIVRCKKKATGVKLVHKTNSFAVLTRTGFFCFHIAS